MFDVGFSELMLIAVVALVVIGPERLPAVARTLGHLFGRLQRYVNDVKADISREIELDELKKFKNQFEEAAQSVESSVRAEVTGAEAMLSSIAAEANPGDPGSAVTPTQAPPGVPEGATTGEMTTAGTTGSATAPVTAPLTAGTGGEPGAPGLTSAAPASASPAAPEQKTAA